MGPVTRRRLALAIGGAVALILILGVAVQALPCSFPGGDFCAADDQAEELVPADALAYVHANLDPDDEDYERATDAGSRIPLLSGQIAERAIALLPEPVDKSLDFDADVRPWFGGEAAIALLPGSGKRSERVVLLEADDGDGAGAFADQIAVGVPHTEEVDGVDVAVGAGGVATAQTGGFLVIGSRTGVGDVIDAATGTDRAESLADDDVAADVRGELPDHRFADAYLSADGIADLVARRRAALSSVTPLISPGASEGAAASLTATEEGDLELAVRSALDPEQAKSHSGFFAAFPHFEPKLPERLAPDSLAYLGFGEPRAAVTALLGQATADAPGVAAAFKNLVERLSEEIDIRRDLLDSLGGEAAFALAPRPEEGQPSLPLLEFVASGVDEDAARTAFAALQGPIAQAVNPGSAGAAPVFDEQEIDGVEARSLQISSAVELTYAVFDGMAAIATDPAAIAQLAGDDDGLDSSDRYEAATEDFDDEVSLLGYFDLGELVATAEQLGLAEDPLYATFAGDFRHLDALGVAVKASEDLLSTDARLLLSDDEDGGGESAPDSRPSD